MNEKEGIEYSNLLETNEKFVRAGLRELETTSVFSPFVLHKLLAVLCQDDCYRNSSYFKYLIPCKDDIQYKKCVGKLMSFLLSLKDSFSVRSKLFLNNNCNVQNHFKDFLRNLHYETEESDVHKPEILVQLINTWIKEKTNGLIEELISPNNLGDGTCLGLANAACFRGKWDKEFTLEATPRTFHLNENDNIQTKMMKLKGEINCSFHDDYKIIELPITSSNNDISLFAFLPKPGLNKKYTLKHHDDMLWELKNWNSNKTIKEVEVLIPKLKTERYIDCQHFFKNLGLKKEFENKVNIFSILESQELFKYNGFSLKGVLNVDEEGVEAANGIATTIEPSEFEEEFPSDGLKILELNLKTEISNRYAKTVVTNKIQNINESAKEATFSMTLPDTAFITEFVMEIEGKTYKSYIKKKEEARATYEEAVRQGKSAGIVETDIRESTRFVVSVNLEPQAIAVFMLTYEEMLQRVYDQYELVLNVCPGQIVKNLNVEVNIHESRPLKFVNTPPLRSGKGIDEKIEKYLTASSDINMVDSNTSTIKFNLDMNQQWKLSNYMGTKGFAGQFIVQYDVERDPKDTEILVQDGYFIHFFAPEDLKPLPKHIIFVLDTSTSMMHEKISQLKDATLAILDDLNIGDLISIIEFNENIIVWNINSEERTTITLDNFKNFEDPFETLQEIPLPSPAIVDQLTLNKAKNVVQKMSCCGNTFMIGALEVALYILKVQQEKNAEHQPMLVFLTDGEPNVGINLSPEIVKLITALNSYYNKVPIFSISFGTGADKSFLRVLSLKNFGFSKHVYEASDASLQLQSFYKQISSPLLANITFDYGSDVTRVTRNHFPIYFKGRELVVSGRCKSIVSGTVNGYGPKGLLQLASLVQNPITSLKRLWAYLSIKQLLDERVITNDEGLTERATELALKHSFVTEVTSLVVVKPDENCDTNSDIPQIGDFGELDFRSMLKKRKFVRCSAIKPLREKQAAMKPWDDNTFVGDHPFLIALVLKREDRKFFLFVGWVDRPTN